MHMRSIRSLAAFALAALCSLGPARAADPVPATLTAFVGADVVPMDSERLLPDQTVLVRGDRILKIGPESEVDVTGAARIDAHGLYLMPGLADMHVHLLEGAAYYPLFLANGVTTVRNMAGGPGFARLRDDVNAGKALGPSIYTAGPLIDSSPPVWPGSDVVKTPEEAARVVQAQKQAGYDFLKAYDNLQVPEYEALMAAAGRYGMRVAGHVSPNVGLERVLADRQWSIEHLTGYFEWLQRPGSPFLRDRQAPQTFPHPAHLLAERQALTEWVDPARIPEIATATAKAGAWNVPTLVAMRNMTPPEGREAAWERPGMSYATAMLKTWWNSDEGYSAKDWDDKRRGDALRLQLVKALHDAGARLLVGTDSPHPFVMPGWSVHDELANFVAAGLSPYEALRAATADAAEFMGTPGEFGVVAVGARADLRLVKGNPLQDVGNAARIVGVMVRGRWLPAGELKNLLDRPAAQ